MLGYTNKCALALTTMQKFGILLTFCEKWLVVCQIFNNLIWKFQSDHISSSIYPRLYIYASMQVVK